MAIAVCAARGPGIIWARAIEVIGLLVDALAVVDEVLAHIPHKCRRSTESNGTELQEVQDQLPQAQGAMLGSMCAVP